MSDSSITLSQLESHLWESANILRGPVDAADFKTYIFPLLFFKRVCDVWDEEYAEIVEEGGDAELALFPESHRFQVPEFCHWKDVREKSVNVGSALQWAMRSIERANPDTLYGVFGDAQWTNKERLSDALLKDLIEHFSRLPLGNRNVASDVLGDAYEYLIKKFADATNKKAGEFYTPRSVVRLMIEMLDPKEGETIYDPACGTGGMLLAAVQHVKEQHGDVKRLWGKLYGQEKNLTTSAIARMNLFLHGIEDFQIVRGDTLRNPAFYDVDRLATFDCVIANPPFSLEKWGEELWANDPFGRNFAGVPPSGSGDFAWVQHMVKSMAKGNGRMAVVLPQGQFRDNLVNYWRGCAVTGCKQLDLLIASHIKPWRDCEVHEATDMPNGLLLSPGLDKAFDYGYITFELDGKIRLSPQLKPETAAVLGIHPEMRIEKGLTDRHTQYLEHHHSKVFRKTA